MLCYIRNSIMLNGNHLQHCAEMLCIPHEFEYVCVESDNDSVSLLLVDLFCWLSMLAFVMLSYLMLKYLPMCTRVGIAGAHISGYLNNPC